MNNKSTYSVLVNNVDNNDELSMVFPVVDKGNSPYLHVPLENLRIRKKNHDIS